MKRFLLILVASALLSSSHVQAGGDNDYEPPCTDAPTMPYEPPTMPYEPPTKPYEPPTKPYEPPTKPYEPPTKPYEPTAYPQPTPCPTTEEPYYPPPTPCPTTEEPYYPPPTPCPTTEEPYYPPPTPCPTTEEPYYPHPTPCPTKDNHYPDDGHDDYHPDCTEISVMGDATYCITGPICSGGGEYPAGTHCPIKGDVASKDCHKHLESWDGYDKCVAKVDSVCKRIHTGAWGCVNEYSDYKAYGAQLATASAEASTMSAGTVAAIAAGCVVAAAVVGLVVFKKRTQKQEEMAAAYDLEATPTPSGGNVF